MRWNVKAVDPFDLPGALLHEYLGGDQHESAYYKSAPAKHSNSFGFEPGQFMMGAPASRSKVAEVEGKTAAAGPDWARVLFGPGRQ